MVAAGLRRSADIVHPIFIFLVIVGFITFLIVFLRDSGVLPCIRDSVSKLWLRVVHGQLVAGENHVHVESEHTRTHVRLLVYGVHV